MAEADGAEAVGAELGDQAEAVAGSRPELMGDRAPVGALRQQALYVGAAGLRPEGLGAQRQRMAQQRLGGIGLRNRLRRVGEAVVIVAEPKQPADALPMQIDIKTHLGPPGVVYWSALFQTT